MANAIELTDANFNEKAEQAGTVAVVDFWAVWCGPCKMIAPAIEELAADFAGKAVVGKLDVDNNQDTSFKFGVRSIPTVVFLKDGKEVDRVVGLTTKAAMAEKVNALLA